MSAVKRELPADVRQLIVHQLALSLASSWRRLHTDDRADQQPDLHTKNAPVVRVRHERRSVGILEGVTAAVSASWVQTPVPSASCS